MKQNMLENTIKFNENQQKEQKFGVDAAFVVVVAFVAVFKQTK